MISLISIVVSFLLGYAKSQPIIPNLSGKCYLELRDLNIGVNVHISARGKGDMYCLPELAAGTYMVHITEAIKYTMMEINNNQTILPNISLGYVMVDGCSRDIVALARTFSFIPAKNMSIWSADTPGEAIVEDCGRYIRTYPVVGMIGPHNSRAAIMAAPILSLAQIPTLGTYQSSDELSDKSRYEYFLRLVAPDRFQVKAIMDFLEYFNFTYVSLLYSEGSYGMNGAKYIELEAKQRGICIAYSKRLSELDTDKNYDEVVEKLVANSKARVVILFVLHYMALPFFQAVERRKVFDYFVWLGSDAIAGRNFGRPTTDKFFYVFFDNGETSPEFAEYFKYLTPDNSTNNPWFRLLWEQYFDCKWDNCEDCKNCSNFSNTQKPDDPVSIWVNKFHDAVWTFGLALDTLIRTKCPKAFRDKSLLNKCVTGKDLLPVMKNTTFKGITGDIKFNKNGDMLGEYTINQYLFNNGKNEHLIVGNWKKKTESITIYEEKISWSKFLKNLDGHEFGHGIPPSVCSVPCDRKQYPVQQEVHCCWICRECRNNEIIVNSSSCEACPPTLWPDDDFATTCIPIEPTYMKPSDVIALGLLALSALLFIMTLIFIAIFIKNREDKLIKASGRELMTIIMVGICLAYLVIFSFVMKPSDVYCYISHFGFNITVTIIYAPLVMKTNRVYRIFTSGKKGVMSLKFISSSSQLLITIIICLMQVGNRSF